MDTKKRGLYEKIVNIVLDILIGVFGIILLVSIYNNIQIKVLGNDYSSFFGFSTFEVQTGSMADTINPGDWIIVKYSNDIKVDDIVTYKKNGEFITHRVVEAYGGTFVTRGDANSSKDDAIGKNQIVGEVVKILPGFGIIRKTFFNPLVLISLIITLYLFGYALRTSKEEKLNKNSEKLDIKQTLDEITSKLIKYIMIFVKNVKKEINSKKQEVNTKPKKEVKIVKEKPKKVIKKVEEKQKEVKEKVKIEEPKEELKEETVEELPQIPEISDEDLDKTMYFRMVPVDKLELDNTYLEIAENELKNSEDKPLEVKDKEVEKIDEDAVSEKLKVLGNKKKKFNNVIEKVMFIKKEELEEIIDILNKGEKAKPNEPTIKDELLNTYIDAKYYNFCGNVNSEYNGKNTLTKIDNEIKNKAEMLIGKYKGSDTKYSDKVNKYVTVITLLNNLEQIYNLFPEIQVKRETYKNKILKTFKTEFISPLELKNMVNNIIKTQKLYRSTTNYILNKLETNTFELNLNKVTGVKNMYGVELNHNLGFSKVYSDYIVDKAYSEGIVAEDKVEVSVCLLLTKVVKDMLNANFNNKYIIYIPESVYTKPNKLDKIFSLFEDEYAKNNIMVLVEYSSLIKNKKVIKKLRKDGYHFVLSFDDVEKMKEKDSDNMYVADYLFVDKKTVKSTNILAFIPDDLEDYIIYEDISEKVGNYGGE